jgi:DHA2 family multidrug resistance protein
MFNPLAGLINDANYMWWAALPVVLGLFIVIMDSSIVNVALPNMMAAYGSNVEEIEWVSTGYMLSSAITMPTTGFLGERFGRKKIYVWSILLFTVTSMMCGAAWDTNSMIFFRVLQGLVGGAIQPIGQAIIFEAFPPEKRGMSMAIVGIGAMFAPTIGPTLGGYLVEFLNWRWIFYVNLIPGIFATFMAATVLRETRMRPVGFDALGFSLMSVFLTTLLLAVSQGNSEGWNSDYIIAMFATAAISGALFLIVELWRAEPVIELALFKYLTYSAGTIVSITVGIGLFGGMFLLPLFLQNLMGYDAIQTGLLMMPQGIAVGVMMPISGALLARIDPRIPMIGGMGLMGYSLWLQAGMTPETSTLELIGWTLIRGVGMGLVFPSMNQTALGAVPIHKIGQASGLFNVTRSVGGSFGIAILSTLLTQRGIYHATHLGEAAAHTGQAAGFIAHVKQLAITHGASASWAQMQASAIWGQVAGREAQILSFQDAFLFTAVLMVVGAVPALLMRKKPQAAHGEAGHAMMAME